MHQLLYNLANIELMKLCKEHSIDCSGSHVVKLKRKWTYELVFTDTNKRIAAVTFHKHSTPSYLIYQY